MQMLSGRADARQLGKWSDTMLNVKVIKLPTVMYYFQVSEV